MDRREAARWQIKRAQRDLLIWIIAVGSAIVFVAAFFISAALADNLDIRVGRTPGFESCANGTCVHGDLPTKTGPKIIHVPKPETQAEQDEADKREHEWLNVCDPTFRRDSFGVEHYVFKKPGCEYGVPE